MKLVLVESVSVGAVLGQTIIGTGGLPLLNAGVVLTREYLDDLRQRGISSLYIEDPDLSDVKPPQPISAELRARSTAHLGQVFSKVTERTESLRESYVALARNDMNSARFADAIRSSVGSAGINAIVGDIDSMLDELKGAQVLAGLNSIKSHDTYTLQHSLDVTIMGLVLARSMGWERWRLRAFGIGCMLHDLGEVFIEPAILNKRGKLTAEEFASIRAHPAVGYDAIRALAEPLGVLVPLVAMQHHERQNGTGYPLGLRGTNALGRNEKGMIHDFGSIAAVADVYDAMTSCRAYRSGWTPHRTITMIRDAAGSHFNRMAVSIMLATVPLYPVLSEVRVRTGKYAGWSGVVTAVSRGELNRPTVRLLSDAAGTRMEPVELSLQADPTIEIDALVPGTLAKAA